MNIICSIVNIKVMHYVKLLTEIIFNLKMQAASCYYFFILPQIKKNHHDWIISSSDIAIFFTFPNIRRVISFCRAAAAAARACAPLSPVRRRFHAAALLNKFTEILTFDFAQMYDAIVQLLLQTTCKFELLILINKATMIIRKKKHYLRFRASQSNK